MQQCIEYALQNNISIKQSLVNIELNKLQEVQNKYAQYPSVNADFSNGLSLGRSIDPTSNQFVNKAYYFNGLNANSNVLLFGWFQKKYAIQQSHLETLASTEQNKQLQNDISLNIATAFLRLLLARAQIKLAENQLQINLEQTRQTNLRVKAGQLPELNLAQMQSQVSSDSSVLISAIADANQSLLDLKTILNMDMQAPFDIIEPQNLEQNNIAIAYKNAQEIYNLAMQKQPNIAFNNYKIQSAQKQIDIVQANKYPQINLGWNLGTNFASSYKQPGSYTYIGESPLGSFKIADSTIYVTRPDYKINYENIPFFTQYGNNLRQTLNLGASIPIFNGYSIKLNTQRAKLNVQIQEYNLQQSKNKLQQDIFRAYNDAQNSLQKYNAALRNQNTATYALELGLKRYNIGMASTMDYTLLQNSVYKAKINTLSLFYDLIFKTKILDFYAGKNIELN